MRNAIILCSGGIDSVTTAYWVKHKLDYSNLIILFFNYGQKALKSERKNARNCAVELDANFEEIKLEWLGKISNSLINKSGRIDKIKNTMRHSSLKAGVNFSDISKMDLKNTKKEGEKYYVPCRNTIFLVNALALAESIFLKEGRIYDIFVGFKNDGKESFPDATSDFVNEMNRLSKISTKGFRIIAPLIKKDKEDIILIGKGLGINYRNTHSCYVKNRHCGVCLACRLRKAGFYWAGVKDETDYA